jgi:hypothetical protein
VVCPTARRADQVREVLAALDARMEQAGLRLHTVQTKIVSCKDRKRRLSRERGRLPSPGIGKTSGVVGDCRAPFCGSPE